MSFLTTREWRPLERTDAVNKDIIATFEDNPGWVRMRVGVKESIVTPTNHGLATILLAAK